MTVPGGDDTERGEGAEGLGGNEEPAQGKESSRC